jgi:metal-responsive CopG/Arc/MetJ family transcriptional regulator
MKTAISIPDDLFKEVTELATKNKTSRSQIFSIAVKEYLERMRSQKLLETLNKVYSDEETDDEKRLRRKSLDYYNRAILTDYNENNTG